MSGPSSQQTPPRPPTVASSAMHVESMPSGYVMLPGGISPQQARPFQVVQGLDGMLYALTTPTAGSKVTDDHFGSTVSPSKSSVSQLSQLSTGTAIPQGLNLSAQTSHSALLAAAAAAQVQAVAAGGGQVNFGALAAAAALQGQNPASQFPFVPIYSPFSQMASSLLTQPGTQAGQAPLLQTIPLGAKVPQPSPVTGTRTLLFPTGRSQKTEDKSVKTLTTPSIQSLLAPSELHSSRDRKRSEQSRSVSLSSDCSPSPTVSQAEQLSSSWSNLPSAATVSLNKDVRSPTFTTSTSSGVDLVHRGAALQRTSHHNHRTEPKLQDKASEKETKMETNPEPSSSPVQNVKSLSLLSRYMNQPPEMKQSETIAAGSDSSLEKLLQTKPIRVSKETAYPSAASLHGQLSGVADERSTMFALLQEEPHLLQFYDFFCKSHLSKHLRIRILTTEGGASVLKWIEVTRQASHIDPSFGPVDPARIVISSNGLCKLQLMFPYAKTMSTRFVPTTMALANELFSELSPKHVICPGLPDCETKLFQLGYQPTNIRVVETPNLKRYDHEKCPIWHIPLPCNLYSESGQILHHICKQCKNLLSTLNKTITKIAGLNTQVGASRNHVLPYDLTVMASSHSASSKAGGLSSPPFLLSPAVPATGVSSEAAGGGRRQEGAKGSQSYGRKRKRRAAHPRNEENPGSRAKSTSTLPEIYQLLRDPPSLAASLSTTTASLHDCTATTSARSFSDRLTSTSSEQSSTTVATPSYVIVQAGTGHQPERSDSSTTSSDLMASVRRTSSTSERTADSPKSKLTYETLQEADRSPASMSDCSSRTDSIEAESSTLHGHTEYEEREQVDVCSSPSRSSAEEDEGSASVVKKQKISLP